MADGGGQSGNYPGHEAPHSDKSEASRHKFARDQQDAYVRTKAIVKVVKVHANKDNPLLPPTIDVQMLSKQTDGKGGTTSHGTIYGIPVKRNQAGDGVLINDPTVGDVGEMSIHDRDISSVVSAQDEATPGSFRRSSPSDGTYYGTIGSKKSPAHYIQWARDQDGKVTSINVTSSAQVNINGVIIDKDGNMTVPGWIKAKQDITAGFGGGDQVSVQQHLHENAGGSGNSGKPVPGT